MNKRVDRLKGLLLQIENYGSQWGKEHREIIFVDILFGVAVYFMMMSKNLVNCIDGIWHTSYDIFNFCVSMSDVGFIFETRKRDKNINIPAFDCQSGYRYYFISLLYVR